MSLILFNCALWDSVPDGFLVWFPWWLRHGAMDPLEGTFCKVNIHWLTPELTHFNLVVRLRLRKVQQSALPFISLFVLPTLPSFCPSVVSTLRTWSRSELPQTFFLDHVQAFDTTYSMTDATGRYTLSRCGDFFLLMVVWWGWTFCASNSFELE